MQSFFSNIKKEPNARVKKLASLLEKYDNVMSGKRTKVKVEAKGKVGGKLDRSKAGISIEIPDDSIESCVIGKAQNLHELGHMLFTRKPKTLYHHWRHQAAYNFLEDQRVEHVLASKYPGMKKYFTYLAEKTNLKGKDPAVLWGRRFFLPYEVPEPEAEIKDVIDDYMISKNIAEREGLAKKFAEVYQNLQKPQPEAPAPQNTSSTRKNSDAEKQASDKAKNQIDKEKKEKKDSEKEKEEKKSDKEKKEQQGQGEQQESQEGEPEEQEGQDPGQGDTDSLQEALSSAMDEMTQEMGAPDSTPSSGQGMFSMGEKPMEKVSHNKLDPKLIEEIYQIFRRVNVELSNTWNRHQKRGRIDIRAAMTSSHNNNSRIFKKYEQSKLQDNKISLVMMYDVSGSMASNDQRGIEKLAVASMAVAASRASNEVCCIEFTYDARIVKNFRDTELQAMSRYAGGTSPGAALKQFKLVKEKARYPIVLILFSDGDFHEELGELASGIKLYKILIGSYALRQHDRYKTWLRMPDTEKLPELLKGIMTEVENEVKMKLLMQR